MKALNSGEKWTCTECDYKHRRRGYLLNHIEREHMAEDFPGYACLRCQQVRQQMLSITAQNFCNFSSSPQYKDPKNLLECFHCYVLKNYTSLSVQITVARHAFHIHMSKCLRLSKLPSKLPFHLVHVENRVARFVFTHSFVCFFQFKKFQAWKTIPLH